MRKTLQEKREALVTFQTATVKHILDLVKALKEKMDQHVKLEENKKAMDTYVKKLAAAEEEKITLHNQLIEYKGDQEQLSDCQATLKRVTLENAQLKEKV